MSVPPDPLAPLRLVKIGGVMVAIRQRITGALYVRWPDCEETFPAGFSVDDVERELRAEFSTPNKGGDC